MKTVYKLVALAEAMKNEYAMLARLSNEAYALPDGSPMQNECLSKGRELSARINGEEKEFTALELLARYEDLIEVANHNQKRVFDDKVERLEKIHRMIDSLIEDMQTIGLDPGDVIDRLNEIQKGAIE